ncbi:hypothetical protein Vretimale_4603, partial [Volvox reticuliferus]
CKHLHLYKASLFVSATSLESYSALPKRGPGIAACGGALAMASRYVICQALQLLASSAPSPSASVLPLQAARCISSSAFRLWPDVIVPSMGESIKEGVIATVHKQARQPVREDEVIAQIETDKGR